MRPTLPPSELQLALRALRPYALRVGAFSVLTALLVLAPTLYMLEVYGRVVESRSLTTLVMLSLMVLVAYAVMEVLDWARTEMAREAAHALDARLTPRVFEAIFQARLKHQAGGTTQPMADLKTLRDFVQSPFVLAAMELPVAVVFLVILFWVSPLLGWFAVMGAAVQALVGWLNDRSTQPPLKEANRNAIAAQQYADGTLRNAEVIEAMGMLGAIHKAWAAKQNLFLAQQAEASSSAGAYQSMGKVWQQVVSSGLLGLACWALLNNELKGGGGMMIGASILGGRILAPLVQLVGQWQAWVNAQLAAQRLEQLLSAVPPAQPGMPLPAPKGLVQVEAVVAAAPGSQVPILKGINFALAPGEVLAVVGPSGCGKTTLARLLVGLWPATSGKVRLDGADVFTWAKTELGPHLGYLPQGVEVFDGTIFENIARFGQATQAEVEAAAARVGLHEMIAALPQGYATRIGRGGMQLSGGQRQRIALARALFGNPALVVLDEPNASLDEAGDAALVQAIAQGKAAGTTFVVVTHRTNVLAVSDKLLLLREGTVQAFGPTQEVLAAMNKAAQEARAAAQARAAGAAGGLPTAAPAGLRPALPAAEA
ncbi:MAG: type I secretion system permease/ATPase [Rhodoferax sp.]